MASKHKKKRNKKYHGADAKVTSPTVLRVAAEERSPLKEWWLTYGQMAKLAGAVAGVILVIILVILGVLVVFQR